MDQLILFLKQNWEWILSIFGGSASLGFGSYKGFKAAQAVRDKTQDTKIMSNKKAIAEIRTELGEVKTELKRNHEADMNFRDTIERIVKDTNAAINNLAKSFSDFTTKYYEDRIRDKERKIDEIQKK